MHEAGDGPRTAGIWAQSLDANSPYIGSSELGRQLVIDLTGEPPFGGRLPAGKHAEFLGHQVRNL